MTSLSHPHRSGLAPLPRYAFPLFVLLPPEIRQQIWATAYSAAYPVRLHDVGPGLWCYQPGCWQARMQIELDSGTFRDEPLHDAELWWSPDTIIFRWWELLSDNLPRSPVPFVNKEAHAVALRCRAPAASRISRGDGGLEHQAAHEGSVDDSDEDDEEEEEEPDKDYDDDEDALNNKIRYRSFEYDTRCDALYINPQSWDNFNSELEVALGEIERDGRPGRYVYLASSIRRIAVSLDCLTSRLAELARISNGFTQVKELLVVVKGEPSFPDPEPGAETAIADEDPMWWEFQDAGKGRFVWTENEERTQESFIFHQEQGKDIRDDELCEVILGLSDELIEKLSIRGLNSGCYVEERFQIRPVVALARKWL